MANDVAFCRILGEGTEPGGGRSVDGFVGGGRSSVVEFQPSKLAVVGSNPIARSNSSVLDHRGRQRVRERMTAVSSEGPRSSVGRARPW